MTQDELLRVIEEAAESGATELDLGSEGIDVLPPLIGKLTSLQSLDLRNNQLTALPPEIVQLTSLQSLELQNNQLESLPLVVVQLVHLQSLDLSWNQLTTLPPGIGEMNLRFLNLAWNALTSLPPEIALLASLQSLDLRGISVTKLPVGIRQLKSLRELHLNVSQLAIPPEIAARHDDPSTVLNYYFEHLEAETRPLNEAKLLLVGEGEVGKTSLVKRLVGADFDPDETQTEGISIRDWPIEVDEAEIRLNVWDFGGQEIMHATHQFFLTERSAYLIVLDHRKGLHGTRLHYWLKIVRSFAGDAPIIIVCNKSDVGSVDLDWTALKRKYRTIRAIVHTSALTGNGIQDLEAAVSNSVGALSHVGAPIRTNWFRVKERLEEASEDFILYSDYCRICSEEGIDDEQSRRTLIRYLHDLGIALNFEDDDHLAASMILNPRWVTDGVYAILNQRDLVGTGVVTLEKLHGILDPILYPREHLHIITDMMIRFEICYEFERDAHTERRYLMPDLLPANEMYTGDWDGALAFVYQYDILPETIVSRFIVRMHPYVAKGTYWRTGVVLTRDTNTALVRADVEARKVEVFVRGRKDTLRSLLAIIRATFDAIHSTVTGLEVEGYVPVPGPSESLVPYHHLLTLEDQGIEEFVPQGTEDAVRVAEMLDGIEMTERQPRQAKHESQSLAAPREDHANDAGAETVGRSGISPLAILSGAVGASIVGWIIADIPGAFAGWIVGSVLGWLVDYLRYRR